MYVCIVEGMQPARGLWGIKHTRKPVDAMVQAARTLPPGTILPMMKLTISTKGIDLQQAIEKKGVEAPKVFYPIDQISYGVQDMVYTRVFSMIVVKDMNIKSDIPFECHGFVCDSRNTVRKLTYALAAAFQEFSKSVKDEEGNIQSPIKKFAIDLRTPEEMTEEAEDETEA